MLPADSPVAAIGAALLSSALAEIDPLREGDARSWLKS